jgi:hypothetical protein
MLVAAELSRLGYEVMLGNIGSHNTKAFDMTAVCSCRAGYGAAWSTRTRQTEHDPLSRLLTSGRRCGITKWGVTR